MLANTLADENIQIKIAETDAGLEMENTASAASRALTMHPRGLAVSLSFHDYDELICLSSSFLDHLGDNVRDFIGHKLV